MSCQPLACIVIEELAENIKKYTAARRTLRHQLELEATDAAPAVKRPRTSRSPQGPQREQEAMQFPVTGPAGGDVMVYGRRRVRA